jgi:hypothetical protein
MLGREALYWLIRPWKADLAITTTAAVARPNHPSYPSGHSCVSSSGAAVLSTFFPEKVGAAGRDGHTGGTVAHVRRIHYRFDIDAGQILGHSVAAFAIAADASGNSVLTPHDRIRRDCVSDNRGGRPAKCGPPSLHHPPLSTYDGVRTTATTS